MSGIIEKRIGEICDVAVSDKSITYSKAKGQEGIYPVYAATVGQPFAYINFYNNDKPCLAVVNDGVAGSTYIITDDKYTIGKHITGLIPHEGINLEYLQFVSAPSFKRVAKGYGLGNLPKADILNVIVEIPITNTGLFDLDEQIRLAAIYSEIKTQRQKLLDRIPEIQELLVHINMDQGINYANVPLNDIVSHNNGIAEYTKIWSQQHKGEYPLYSANNSEPLAHIDTFDYDGEYLTYSKNGCAGYITIIDGRFSINGDRCVMTINRDFEGKVNLLYLKYYLEPIFRQHKKGRLGAYGKNEFTKINSTMIKELNIQIPLPLTDSGEYDLEKQIEIAKKYEQIDTIKAGLIERITQLTSINVATESKD